MSVNEVIRRHPATVAVFNDFGIDACCGGDAPVEEAARRDGADPATLLAALDAAIAEASGQSVTGSQPRDPAAAGADETGGRP